MNAHRCGTCKQNLEPGFTWCLLCYKHTPLGPQTLMERMEALEARVEALEYEARIREQALLARL